jgi:hypothetical protein
LNSAPPVAPVIVDPETAVIAADVGVEPVLNDAVVEIKVEAIVAVLSTLISAAVSAAAVPLPTKNRTVYAPDASGVKFSVSDCVAVESPVAET